MATIAGHAFGANGFCTFSIPNCERTCGKRFSDISMAKPEDIGKPGWAHYGNLTGTELSEITQETERIWLAHRGS